MAYEFKLPDIGEGLVEGEVIKWHVKEGDSVSENQPLVNVLTDKAEVEIPSPKTGKIGRLMAKEGQKVKVGGVLVVFELPGDAKASESHNGHGAAPAAAPKAQSPVQAAAPQRPAAAGTINATPGVRKLASDLRVDLAGVAGTGPGGRITEDDVKKASGGAPQKTASPKAGGPENRVPYTGIRRRTGDKMVQSARAIPHVTHVDEADCGALVALREELKAESAQKGVKLTYLPFIIQALTRALKAFPNLNSSLDEGAQEITHKKYYNIGIATATDHGLYVPNIKDADKKGVWELASEIEKMGERARNNKLELAELQGGTFTLTNIGPIGGLYATPIILHPEVAILGLMKMQPRPVVRDGSVIVRPVMNLCLSFDHRVLDGAEAANFTNTLMKHLENPRTLL